MSFSVFTISFYNSLRITVSVNETKCWREVDAKVRYKKSTPDKPILNNHNISSNYDDFIVLVEGLHSVRVILPFGCEYNPNIINKFY